jgi:hypothetical protein
VTEDFGGRRILKMLDETFYCNRFIDLQGRISWLLVLCVKITAGYIVSRAFRRKTAKFAGVGEKGKDILFSI